MTPEAIRQTLAHERDVLRHVSDVLHDDLRAYLSSGGHLDDAAAERLVIVRGQVDVACSALQAALEGLCAPLLAGSVTPDPS
jgi:hypothetical protein